MRFISLQLLRKSFTIKALNNTVEKINFTTKNNSRKKLALLLLCAALMLSTYAQAQWTKISNSHPDVSLYDVYAKSPRIISVGYSLSGFVPYIFISNNNGNTWDSIMIASGGRLLKTIAFKDKDTGYIGGFGAKAFWMRTTNGGLNWDYSATDLKNTGVTDIMFLNDKIGFAGGFGHTQFSSGMSYFTTDGGVTWYHTDSASNSAIDTIPVSRIHFVNTSTGYGINAELLGNKELMKTTDSGINWHVIYTHSTYIGGIWFWDSNNGIMTDNYGKILKTTDGGYNWVPKSTPISTPLTAIAFMNNMEGYAVGFYGKILKTTDGGETWTQEASPTTDVLNRLRIFDNIAYAAGDNGTIVASQPVTGIKERTVNKSFTIYPNPAKSSIELQLPNMICKGVKIYDMAGRIVLSKETSNITGSATIDISTLAKGIYKIVVESDNSIQHHAVFTKN